MPRALTTRVESTHYGAKTQFVSDPTHSPALSDNDVNKLQQLTGTLLYYARAVDPTLIMPINVLASEQANATEVTADKVTNSSITATLIRKQNTVSCI
jgi:hypothetical protein